MAKQVGQRQGYRCQGCEDILVERMELEMCDEDGGNEKETQKECDFRDAHISRIVLNKPYIQLR